MADQYDVIVVGAGAAGLTAACVAAVRGCSVLLLEQAAQIGGTSAISGGMVWMPANDKMKTIGLDDDLEKARQYLYPLTGDASNERLDAFLERSSEALTFLERHTSVRLRPVRSYPDYYPFLAGAQPGGRVLEPVPFDATKLGEAFAWLRPPLPEFMLLGGMMVSREDIAHFRRFGRSLGSSWRVLGLVASYLKQRIAAPRGTTLYLGNALIARLLKSARDVGVDMRLGASVNSLLLEQGRVIGVQANVDGKVVEFHGKGGVVLATGGLSQDAGFRAHYVPETIGACTATVPRNGAACGARLATTVDARMSDPAEGSGFWVPISSFTYRDGSPGYFPHTVTDRGKPGMIAVAADGKRFVNEALSYHEFGLAQIARGRAAIPAHLICDSAFLWKYGIGRIRPFTMALKPFIASGYLRTAQTIEELAAHIGVPPAVLNGTVARFNKDAAHGQDHEFERGADIYQRHLGDGEVQPNPCVAPVAKPPFYSVAVRPGDLGMSAGIVTSPTTEVLSSSGESVPGLYACGNDMQSVMNGAYPGPGITLGPALTFGYVAATRIADGLQS
ncbi:FAD-dependent oxidoreductase [Novosphingobium mangrovi (ex Huang et al. 2023)]|uniref:FAD-dependent oxidoreductase n=1 Tax=Novosphingobium mangrovi (ex Huang et al. 2023) TaxID=2976432 RepID=A0ABT2I8S2_9SPHN|nr:FAD-dependent oxidoreductase [Novosphingobium mangrovi (ex Huang et al. 2023)]MCT2401198.1 FAD-dependent oxidoreductase [Novosphingobium mangrovi (ex Huang et al. 2023)]